ncbi:MAG: hypothetical protein ACJA0C_001566 [Candidatus Endobugula sp.]|jgi:hypothetical protein
MTEGDRAVKRIISVRNDGRGQSIFSYREVELAGTAERMLSEQLPAVNFRLRESDASYASSFHVAGDPTLLIVLSGTLRIVLRNGESRDFSAGKMFVAEDYLAAGEVFDDTEHGHRAEVVSDVPLSALHLKLEGLTSEPR